ncbi:hypothetical protein ACN27E_25450 [Mycobacterium sp. WMMD1722]|uniref:hypothetical protein n=1 Tax=Mycobacterium sp. WMMD1722 TaxID=3404117 RepID=UPI003BF4D808
MVDGRRIGVGGIVVAAGIGLAAMAGQAVASADTSGGEQGVRSGHSTGPASTSTPRRVGVEAGEARGAGASSPDRPAARSDAGTKNGDGVSAKRIADARTQTRVAERDADATSISTALSDPAAMSGVDTGDNPQAPAVGSALWTVLGSARRTDDSTDPVDAGDDQDTHHTGATGDTGIEDPIPAADNIFFATGTATAAKTSGNPPWRTDLTRGFTVTNLSAHEVVLTSQSYEIRGSGPSTTSALPPGGSQHFELSRFWFDSNTATLTYRQSDSTREYTVTLRNNAILAGGSEAPGFAVRCSGGPCTARDTWDEWSDQVSLLDETGTSIAVPKDRQDAQVKAINALCANGNATCRFIPKTTDENAFSELHPTGTTLANSTGNKIEKTVTVSDVATVTSNIKLSAKVALDVLKLAKAEFNAEYGRQWTDSHTFSEAMKFFIEPGNEVTVFARTPVIRYYGDMEITIGNTTVVVSDIYFDSPRSDAGSGSRFEVVETKIGRPGGISA